MSTTRRIRRARMLDRIDLVTAEVTNAQAVAGELGVALGALEMSHHALGAAMVAAGRRRGALRHQARETIRRNYVTAVRVADGVSILDQEPHA